MIFKIAYRNIWRNPWRSWVLIAAIAMGIWGGLTVIGLARGLTKLRQDQAISTYLSELQIHQKDYLELGEQRLFIPQADAISQELNTLSAVRALSLRMRVESYIQSTQSASVVVLNGVDPKQEKRVLKLWESGPQGNFLTNYKRKPPIVLGAKLAERLNAEVGESVQCSFTDAQDEQLTAVFKVVDVFNTSNSMYDELNAFVLNTHLASLFGERRVHEMVLRLNDEKVSRQLQSELQSKYEGVQVDSWRELAPELGLADRMLDLVMSLFLVIIMFALSFGIVNTMLMAVLERQKELGMLKAIGMNKKKLFRMIAWESVLLSTVSVPVGMGLALLTNMYLSTYGIDLSFLSEGLRSVGLSSMLYEELESIYYLKVSILVFVTAVISCLYPAYKALKMNPVETIRTAE